MQLEKYQSQLQKGRKTHMDVAATDQYNQEALKLKAEKTSFLPAPGIY